MPEYSVPQFIEDEARIIFFLTFRQFFILVGGGFLCFLSYYFLPFIIASFCIFIILALVILIGFVKIKGDSVVKIVLHFLGFSIASKNYTWQKSGSGQISPEMQNYEKPNFKPQSYIKKTGEGQGGQLQGTKKNIELT